MKRTVEESETVHCFSVTHLWQFCEQAGITQELKKDIPEEVQNDADVVRLCLQVKYPKVYELLKITEHTYELGTFFMQSVLNNMFRVANIYLQETTKELPPSKIAPVTAAVQPQKSAPKKNKGDPKTADRTEVLNKYAIRRDILGKKDYGPDWLAKFAVVGTAVRAHSILTDYSQYTTIYHCYNAWGMEEIVNLLQDEGFLAFGIRDDVNKSEECVRYKVITNEPYL